MVAPAPGGPPPELERFRVADWADETEPVPPHAAHWTWPEWHHVRAWRRFLDAKRAWRAAQGLPAYEQVAR
jgi:hypothetical protein